MFSVTTTDSGVMDALNKAAGLSAVSFDPELRRLGDTLLQEIGSEFFGERDPYGQPWAPLKAISVLVKREKGSPNAERILQDTGALKQSFKWEVVPGGLSIYTDRRFNDGVTAAIHQLGGVHPRTNSFIPPREMLPFRDQLPPEWMQWTQVFTEVGVDRLFR